MDENHKDIPKYDETNNYQISENSDQSFEKNQHYFQFDAISISTSWYVSLWICNSSSFQNCGYIKTVTGFCG